MALWFAGIPDFENCHRLFDNLICRLADRLDGRDDGLQGAVNGPGLAADRLEWAAGRHWQPSNRLQTAGGCLVTELRRFAAQPHVIAVEKTLGVVPPIGST